MMIMMRMMTTHEGEKRTRWEEQEKNVQGCCFKTRNSERERDREKTEERRAVNHTHPFLWKSMKNRETTEKERARGGKEKDKEEEREEETKEPRNKQTHIAGQTCVIRSPIKGQGVWGCCCCCCCCSDMEGEGGRI